MMHDGGEDETMYDAGEETAREEEGRRRRGLQPNNKNPTQRCGEKTYPTTVVQALTIEQVEDHKPSQQVLTSSLYGATCFNSAPDADQAHANPL